MFNLERSSQETKTRYLLWNRVFPVSNFIYTSFVNHSTQGRLGLVYGLFTAFKAVMERKN